MTRSSIVFLSVFVCALSANAQHRTPTPTPCPPGVTEIRNCPVKGCASGAKAKLNEAKNMRSTDGTMLAGRAWPQHAAAILCNCADSGGHDLNELLVSAGLARIYGTRTPLPDAFSLLTFLIHEKPRRAY
jgi:endonuclease YncB( thermonuclease family)